MTPAEARPMISLLPGTREFAVYDCRGFGSPGCSIVRPRPWAESGARIFEVDAIPDGLAVLVIAEGDMDLDDQATGYATRPGSRVLRTRSDDGQLTHAGSPIEDRDGPVSGPWTLRLRGRGPSSPSGELELVVDHLPASVAIRVPADLSAALFRVEIEGPDSTLPEPRWFRLRGRPGKIRLTVDIDPSLDEDRWSLSGPGGLSCEPTTPPSPRPISRLIIVFDRTCPDVGSWGTARKWNVRADERADEAVDILDTHDQPNPTPAVVALEPDSGRFNASIREGLEVGLRRVLSATPGMALEVVWFADVAGEGLVSPEAWDVQQDPVGRRGPLAPGGLAGALGSMGYVTGLDLWDPLDRAVAEASRLIRPGGSTAVVIVGNSPPHMPREAANPFWRIITGSGVPSSYRRIGFIDTVSGRVADFQDALDAVDKAGARIGYVFLAGHETAGSGASGTRFDTIQSLVRDALEEYLPIFDASANRDGVEDGVTRAVASLGAEVSRVSVWKEASR